MSLQVGAPAPYFKGKAVMPDGEFREISLDDYKGRWLVLFFYPLDFTFVCPTEIQGYNAAFDEFQAQEADIIGASIDSEHSHKAWIEHGLGKLKFPLLSDLTKEISRRYRVLLEDAGIATRGTFIINPEGVIEAYIVTQPSIGRSVKETLRLLEAAKAAHSGEMVPCDWQPGEATL